MINIILIIKKSENSNNYGRNGNSSQMITLIKKAKIKKAKKD